MASIARRITKQGLILFKLMKKNGISYNGHIRIIIVPSAYWF